MTRDPVLVLQRLGAQHSHPVCGAAQCAICSRVAVEATVALASDARSRTTHTAADFGNHVSVEEQLGRSCVSSGRGRSAIPIGPSGQSGIAGDQLTAFGSWS